MGCRSAENWSIFYIHGYGIVIVVFEGCQASLGKAVSFGGKLKEKTPSFRTCIRGGMVMLGDD